GSASGYQGGLYYHARRRELGDIEIVEWHCGAEYGVYHHVYPMFAFAPRYWGADEAGTYYHWVSFVDPERVPPMIPEGMPPVHSAEARSLKGVLESARGLRHAASGALALTSHTIYIEAPMDGAVAYFADPANVTEWGFMLRREGAQLVDEYERPVDVRVTLRDLGPYKLIEHDSHYADAIVRAPIVLIPCAYAFGRSDAPGLIMHRITAWPRPTGKAAPDDYMAEAINAKRIVERQAGNLEAFGRGCSYAGGRRS
ncbi:MAG TPA: hypothetical protein VK427_01820, partial [Kofleriaceae bacterium]|nr:hypothetical protein [Kofleriaceae bacterium]